MLWITKWPMEMDGCGVAKFRRMFPIVDNLMKRLDSCRSIMYTMPVLHVCYVIDSVGLRWPQLIETLDDILRSSWKIKLASTLSPAIIENLQIVLMISICCCQQKTFLLQMSRIFTHTTHFFLLN